MAIIAADITEPRLPVVRRLEAAGFRAWPASRVTYDGSWQLRLTPGHPSKRLNSLVPLDPGDTRDMKTRIAEAASCFDRAGVKAAIRQTPLCPPDLPDLLASTGWQVGHETLVMAADLGKIDLSGGMDHLPTHDIQRFAEACVEVDGRETTPSVLGAIITSIEPPAGLFLMQDADRVKAVGICVQDNDLAGLQQIVVEPSSRRQGIGRELVTAALRWAKLRGAQYAWLQVIADNAPACRLYKALGFNAVYSYSYWQRAGQ